MKNVFGGTGCSLVVPNANGTYTTIAGVCNTKTVKTLIADGAGGVQGHTEQQSFCDTGDGVAHTLSSNGGVSRC